MAGNAKHTTGHATKDQDRSTTAACDEQDQGPQARHTRQMALIDGVVRDYEPTLRELALR